MYSFSRNPYVLIGSRLIAGIGIGPAASILGMISRATTKENRTSTISLVYSLRQVGDIIGPGFNLILREPIFHFRIGYFNINQYTLPTVCNSRVKCLIFIFCFNNPVTPLKRMGETHVYMHNM